MYALFIKREGQWFFVDFEPFEEKASEFEDQMLEEIEDPNKSTEDFRIFDLDEGVE